jgi:hypothetical protein
MLVQKEAQGNSFQYFDIFRLTKVLQQHESKPLHDGQQIEQKLHP